MPWLFIQNMHVQHATNHLHKAFYISNVHHGVLGIRYEITNGIYIIIYIFFKPLYNWKQMGLVTYLMGGDLWCVMYYENRLFSLQSCLVETTTRSRTISKVWAGGNQTKFIHWLVFLPFWYTICLMPCNAYLHQSTGLPLSHVMSCRLFGAKSWMFIN